MSHEVNNATKPCIAFIGIGLIGGSWALALRRAGAVSRILALDSSQASLHRALELGVIDAIADVHDLSAADVIILSVPVGAMEEVCRQITTQTLKANCVISDVGSSKASVLAAVAHAFGGEVPAFFVPGHPIAGREYSGVDAARADLFDHHRVILTPLPHTDPYALGVISRLWLAAGAFISCLDVQQHDEILAATSHLPHVLSYVLVDMLAQSGKAEAMFAYSAGGFRDFTRIASGDPIMWRDICLNNRAPIRALLEAYRAALDLFLEQMQAGDGAAIEERFRRAKTCRDDHYRKESS